tara:strand:+ start:3094 stop:3504 length:411 start_codon:yes stop_codon:yes gene_type:complete
LLIRLEIPSPSGAIAAVGDTSDSRRRKRQGRTGSRIALTVLAALIVTGSAAQQANLYAERNILLQLEEIVWSETAASRYPAKFPMPAKESVWEHLDSNSTVASTLERYQHPIGGSDTRESDRDEVGLDHESADNRF